MATTDATRALGDSRDAESGEERVNVKEANTQLALNHPDMQGILNDIRDGIETPQDEILGKLATHLETTLTPAIEEIGEAFNELFDTLGDLLFNASDQADDEYEEVMRVIEAGPSDQEATELIGVARAKQKIKLTINGNLQLLNDAQVAWEDLNERLGDIPTLPVIEQIRRYMEVPNMINTILTTVGSIAQFTINDLRNLWNEEEELEDAHETLRDSLDDIAEQATKINTVREKYGESLPPVQMASLRVLREWVRGKAEANREHFPQLDGKTAVLIEGESGFYQELIIEILMQLGATKVVEIRSNTAVSGHTRIPETIDLICARDIVYDQLKPDERKPSLDAINLLVQADNSLPPTIAYSTYIHNPDAQAELCTITGQASCVDPFNFRALGEAMTQALERGSSPYPSTPPIPFPR